MKSNEQQKNYNEYSFGKYIHDRRRELGLTIRELAKKMEISVAYLCDIENGHRKAPITSEKGKSYMVNFIKYLKINESEVAIFYEMALATRYLSYKIPIFPNDYCADITDYLKCNKQAQAALRLAMEINLSDEEWQTFITHLLKLKK